MAAQLEQVLNVALLTPMDDPSNEQCRWGAPILLWGEPGIGKSDRVEQAGEVSDLAVETLYLSTLQPEDISGIPMGNAKDGVSRVCDLVEVQNLTTLGRGILFLDELSTVRPAVQGAGLGVVHKRRIAGKRLPGKVRVVAAANPADSAAGGWTLTPPLANRFLHLDVNKPSADEWVAWLLGNNTREDASAKRGEELVQENWSTAWPMFCGLVAGFIRSNAARLYDLPVAGNPSRGKAWSSHRTWEIAARCMAAAQALDKKELALDLLEAAVGKGPCAEFATWMTETDLPDPADVLEGGWSVNPDRLDINFAVLASATAYALSKQNKDEQRAAVVKMWEVLTKATKDGSPDVAMYQAKILMKAGYTTKAGGEVERVAKPLIAYFGAGLANQL